MKKLFTILVLMVVIGIGVTILNANNRFSKSIISLNVEALLDDELPPNFAYCFEEISETYDPELYLEVRYCETCDFEFSSYCNYRSICLLSFDWDE